MGSLLHDLPSSITVRQEPLTSVWCSLMNLHLVMNQLLGWARPEVNVRYTVHCLLQVEQIRSYFNEDAEVLQMASDQTLLLKARYSAFIVAALTSIVDVT